MPPEETVITRGRDPEIYKSRIFIIIKNNEQNKVSIFWHTH
jgi:hypothetical protein